mmetsp:Transcript_743/g.1973  ORF Transcript_743/g.1973 Transcript_743/m.1973 type:complete len:233 (-) Transcript_743:96-794(-)
MESILLQLEDTASVLDYVIAGSGAPFRESSSAGSESFEPAGDARGNSATLWSSSFDGMMSCFEYEPSTFEFQALQATAELNLFPTLATIAHDLASTPASLGTLASPSKNAAGTKRSRNSSRKMAHSNFCHVCSRPSKRYDVLACNRISSATGCCKVVCRRCFDATTASEPLWASGSFDEFKTKESEYTCLHCTRMCPPNARCHVYNVVNEKRKKVASRATFKGSDTSEIEKL